MYKQLDTSEPLDRIVELNHRHINTSSSLLEPGIGGYERGHNEVTLFSHSLSLFIYFLSGDWKEWSRLIAVVETTTPCTPILEHQGYPRRKKGLCSKDQGREGGERAVEHPESASPPSEPRRMHESLVRNRENARLAISCLRVLGVYISYLYGASVNR